MNDKRNTENSPNEAGRVEDPGTRNAGVWPRSTPPPDDRNVQPLAEAAFGQGERGAAGYFDSGDSEVRTMPPGDGPMSRLGAGVVGEEGSNAGEVDPGVSGRVETIGETPEGLGGGATGFGNAGGGDTGDAPPPTAKPPD